MYYVVDNNKIMKRGIENIDLGDSVPIKIPYGERKHVTFLLGSGFSVPCGMPTGKQLNDFVLNINNYGSSDISSDTAIMKGVKS